MIRIVGQMKNRYIKMNQKLSALTFLTTIAVAGSAAAEDSTSYPKVYGEWIFETQLEHGYNSDDVDGERSNLFGRSEFVPTIELNENFSIDATLVLEPLKDSKAGINTFFDKEGIFAETLKVNYQNGAFGAFAGKFNPDFGIAWDFGRGIWSEDFAEDYEITQKLGFGATYTVETPESGAHTFAASTFFADTTFLSESIITTVDRVRQSDGGQATRKTSHHTFLV